MVAVGALIRSITAVGTSPVTVAVPSTSVPVPHGFPQATSAPIPLCSLYVVSKSNHTEKFEPVMLFLVEIFLLVKFVFLHVYILFQLFGLFGICINISSNSTKLIRFTYCTTIRSRL